MNAGEITTCEKWNAAHSTEPVMLWLTPQFNLRHYGFVGKLSEHSVIWRRTKKEILAEMAKVRR